MLCTIFARILPDNITQDLKKFLSNVNNLICLHKVVIKNLINWLANSSIELHFIVTDNFSKIANYKKLIKKTATVSQIRNYFTF